MKSSIWLKIVAVITALCGLGMLYGGAILIAHGGSWYYLISGIVLIISAWGLYKWPAFGVGLYLIFYLATIIWSFAERGTDFWAWVPRLDLWTVLLLLIGLGFLFKKEARKFGATLSVVSVLIFVGFLAGAWMPHHYTYDASQVATTPVAENSLPATQADSDWETYGRDHSMTRFSPLAQINAQNVKDLKVAWTFRTGDLPSEKWGAENTPIKVGNGLYVCTARNNLIRVDPTTGKKVWEFDSHLKDANIPYTASCRGVVYYTSKIVPEGQACHARIIEATLDMRLIAVDSETGKLCAGFGDNGQTNLLVGMGYTVPGQLAMTAAPTLVNDNVIVNHQVLDGQNRWAPSGVIRAFSAETGKFSWAWDMMRPNDHSEKTLVASQSSYEEAAKNPDNPNEYTRGTVNAWTGMTADPKLNTVYVSTGNSSADYWSAERRPEENAHSSAVVALDASTGQEKWTFQTVHKDVWDYDIGPQVTLMDMNVDGKSVPALIQATKRGQTFVINRVTGQPIVKVEEKPAPAAYVKGDPRAPTQPWSAMPRMGMPDLTEAQMWGVTPFDQLFCRIKFKKANYLGEFTPPSVKKPWIEFPGYNGGTDWGSAAYDPQTGLLVANWSNTPMYDQLMPRKEADAEELFGIDDPRHKAGGGSAEGAGAQAHTPYAAAIDPFMNHFTNMLCNEPPYGLITAVNMHTQKVVWQRPLGTAKNNGPFNIPTHMDFNIGTPNNGGPMMTAGGLTFIAAATDDNFRAIDNKTGKTLWSVDLPAGGQANPMTYSVNGKQYVVIGAYGHHFMGTKEGDYVIAYALPDK